MKITHSTRVVQLHPGYWVGRRDLLATIRGIVASKAYQAKGRAGLKQSTCETLDCALSLVGALDAAKAEKAGG